MYVGGADGSAVSSCSCWDQKIVKWNIVEISEPFALSHVWLFFMVQRFCFEWTAHTEFTGGLRSYAQCGTQKERAEEFQVRCLCGRFRPCPVIPRARQLMAAQCRATGLLEHSPVAVDCYLGEKEDTNNTLPHTVRITSVFFGGVSPSTLGFELLTSSNGSVVTIWSLLMWIEPLEMVFDDCDVGDSDGTA